MATMIPENIAEFTTEGERQFYKFLECVAKPDSRHITWYTPNIEGKEPDFILCNQNVGLIIFEIKDWMLDQIQEANPQYFRLQVGNKIESRKNPFQQSRDYLYDIVDKIKKDGQLIARDPVHHGKIKIPFSCGVVFPNINRGEYTGNGFDEVTGADKVFFWDDLHPSSKICSDPTGKCFQDALEEKFAPPFKFSLTGSELQHLKQLLFPTVKIELPERDNGQTYEKRIERLKILDHHQEAIARNFDGGHRIISGPPGSGKTLVLAHKAAFLKQYNPAIKNILFVCYNITLVQYIKRLLADKLVPMGEDGVTVCHFFELCGKIIGEEIVFEKEDAEYYEMVLQEALSKAGDYLMKYDATLVDEGQDFSKDMLKVVTALLNPKTNNLTIAVDDNQNIYREKPNWKDMGVQVRGRVHKIPCVYRNTTEISEFASRFMKPESGKPDKPKTDQHELFPDFSDFHGPNPELNRFKSFEDITGYVGEKIREIVNAEKSPYSEFAILYAMKNPGKNLKSSFPQMIESTLESKGILSEWVSENYRSKKAYDVTTNNVTISTIHSVKGFDYSTVFLFGLDFLEPNGWTEQQINNLVYVAITRARYRLIIPYIRKNSIVERLIECVNIKDK
jgi:UvrD-like helicase C-terminal domain/AAA domain